MADVTDHDEGELEFLRDIVDACIRGHETASTCVERIMEAGFTRRRDQGETRRDTVECWYCIGSGYAGPDQMGDGEEPDNARCLMCEGIGRLDLDAVRKMVDDEACDHDVSKGALLKAIEDRDAAIRERDEARAEAAKQANNCEQAMRGEAKAMEERTTLRAERDALAAKLAESEAELAVSAHTEQKCGEERDAAEARATALAEALRGLVKVAEPIVTVADSLFHFPAQERRESDKRAIAAVLNALVDCDRLLRAANTTTPAEDGWIACSERMPDKHGTFLVVFHATETGYTPQTVTTGWYDDDRDPEFAPNGRWMTDCHCAGNVTHWRALPAPPTAGEKE